MELAIINSRDFGAYGAFHDVSILQTSCSRYPQSLRTCSAYNHQCTDSLVESLMTSSEHGVVGVPFSGMTS